MASGTYALSSRMRFTPGGVVIVASSVLAAVLVIAGLVYATGTGERHRAALAAAGCEPNLSPSGQQCTTYQMLTEQYEGVVTPTSRQLSTDLAAYTANEKTNLAAARLALIAEAAAERAFGTSLAAFPFPPAVASLGKTLLQADQARATLTAAQARSASLKQLWSLDHGVLVASTTVRTDMALVRKALDTPPPAS